ncbi:MAG TPA: tetratricopeptide repeat protein [Phnomibacter sp.]|nr:tetratricopeptide repeat protein [Phnomibacter sp.]
MKLRYLVASMGLCTALLIFLECCRTGEVTATAKNEYTGSASCRSCHAPEHDEWLSSHHYMAMQPATDSTVLGDFNDAVLQADGMTTRFFKMDGKYYINTEDATGTYRDMEVKYIFGFTPLQQYLVEFPGGRMQATRMSWDTKAKKWFHQYAGDKIPPGDWLHWTGNGQNWNTMCASCHSTNVRKGYEFESDTYHTTWNEINVSCESCHGPGSDHISYINGNDYKKGKKVAGSLLLMYRAEGHMAQVNACGYCHARRTDITENVHPGKEVLQDHIPELPVLPYFHADGQMDDEDYNYAPFLQSKMYKQGVRCTDCHNPHTNKLKLEGPLVCGQCHAPDTYVSEKHTLHKVGTVGVNCISCHMPSKYYMGNDLRHDHSFRVPRPDLTAKYGTPNTCNACHSDKSAQWAADAVQQHFGRGPAYHFSEDLIPGSRLNAESALHLTKLAADSAIPNIIRAATLHYIGQLQNDQSRQLLSYLRDSSALVRYTALRGLRSYPYQAWTGSVLPLLKDPVRAVRIAAADLFTGLQQDLLPATALQDLAAARAELQQYIWFQTDFAQGNLLAGDHFNRMGDAGTAERLYRRAILKDSQLVNARVNLAALLNASRRNEEALQQLELSARIQPRSDHVFYTLGLLYAEMGDLPKAERSLQQAATLNSSNVRAMYNHGLLLAQQEKKAEAEKKYLQALAVDPANGSVLNALTILYLQQGQMDKARETGMKLKKYHGNDPAYRDLLGRMRLL